MTYREQPVPARNSCRFFNVVVGRFAASLIPFFSVFISLRPVLDNISVVPFLLHSMITVFNALEILLELSPD